MGKGTLIAGLREELPELEMSVSATTRRPRPGESDGREYHFLDPDEFERRVDAGEFLEHAEYSGNRYGTLRSEADQRLARGVSVILEIEIQGAREVRKAMPEAVEVFISPPDAESLRQRLEGRGTDEPDAIERRLATAAVELEAQEEFPNVIVNDDLQEAREQLISLVRRHLSLD